METTLLAIGLGLVSGVLALLAYRLPWLGWVMLTPLCAAIYLLQFSVANVCKHTRAQNFVVPTSSAGASKPKPLGLTPRP
jgi:hypothetical protein